MAFMSNTSTVPDLPPLPGYTLTRVEPLIPPIPDNILALFLPIVAYWVISLTFHYIDVNDYFPQYRLHTPAELLKRNHVSRSDVVRDVILQQVIQTLFGLIVVYYGDTEYHGKEEYDVANWARTIRIAQKASPYLFALVGVDSIRLAATLSEHPLLAGILAGGNYPGLVQNLVLGDGSSMQAPAFAQWELVTASFIYWYFIPALQFIGAIMFVDTWQYFLHRLMHINKWLYVTFHSRHHRLYVPYAFGALYNHPVEGFFLDTAGTGLAFLLSGMTSRQSMWFFTISTIKTVDDHCGYAFPWDPLQRITGNNSAFHDIHHQTWGVKTNYSQPFFIFWDRLLGTQWKGEVSLRYERSRATAHRQASVDNAGPSDSGLGAASVSKPALFDQESPECKKITKEADEATIRMVKSQSIQARTHARPIPADSLDRVGHLMTGSIRQK